MKKIRKNDLRLEKEVISKLTQCDLNVVKGGTNLQTVYVENCSPQKTKPYCPTINQATCAAFLCQQTAVAATCPAATADAADTCRISGCTPCKVTVNICIQPITNQAYNCNAHG